MPRHFGNGLNLTSYQAGLAREAPPGYGLGVMRDRAGGRLTTIDGARMVAPAAQYETIAQAMGGRGILFGVAVDIEQLQASPEYAALVDREASLITFMNDMKPRRVQQVQGVFDFTNADAGAAWAIEHNKAFRVLPLMWPVFDMPWVSEETVTAETWQEITDLLFEAYAARPWARLAHSIDVANEISDPLQSDGFRRHAWFNAGGPEWLVYSFRRAAELFPAATLYLCQDMQEQLIPGFDAFGAFLKVVDYLLDAGAPIDGVNLQGHLIFSKRWHADAFRAHLEALRSRGLLIVAGEVDVRTGNEGPFTPANYSAAGYDAIAAEMLAQYLEILSPHVTGGEVSVWGLSDRYGAWGDDERACLFDKDLAIKPASYSAFVNAFGARETQWQI